MARAPDNLHHPLSPLAEVIKENLLNRGDKLIRVQLNHIHRNLKEFPPFRLLLPLCSVLPF